MHWVADGAEGPPEDKLAQAAEKEAKAKEYADFEQLFNSGIILLPMTQDSELLHLDFQNMNGQLTETALNILAKYKDEYAKSS